MLVMSTDSCPSASRSCAESSEFPHPGTRTWSRRAPVAGVIVNNADSSFELSPSTQPVALSPQQSADNSNGLSSGHSPYHSNALPLLKLKNLSQYFCERNSEKSLGRRSITEPVIFINELRATQSYHQVQSPICSRTADALTLGVALLTRGARRTHLMKQKPIPYPLKGLYVKSFEIWDTHMGYCVYK